MTDEKLTQICAELDEWKFVPSHDICGVATPDCWVRGEDICWKDYPADYPNSRDAIIPAIVRWCEENNEGWIRFCVAIRNELKIVGTIPIRSVLKFKPKQLAITLVKAAGRWED